MKTKFYSLFVIVLCLVPLTAALLPAQAQTGGARAAGANRSFDVVVVGGTPGGIMTAVAAARMGQTAVILERTRHIGGLPANGLGATDIATRGATGGLFHEFVNRVHNYYVKTNGADSQQVKDASDGYHFEPSVAERVFNELIKEHPSITVLLERQFDALPANCIMEAGRITQIEVTNLQNKQPEQFRGRVFIDATYEGDLAAAAGVPYRLGREGASEFNEPRAGQLYVQWQGPVGAGTTGLGDNAIQSYNYRLPLTRRSDNLVPIQKPQNYNRDEYASLIEDIRLNRVTGPADAPRREIAFDGIGRVVNMVILPNGKTDANNQHASFLSTDLPEENWPWPTSSWEWRDRFSKRLREYTLGLIYFIQNDPELPADFRRRAQGWGLARDEYTDNGNFPRQVYVREGRRIEGEHLFTAHDARPVKENGRPPIYANSITASHYALDSHAVRKREAGRVHLDGFFSYPTRPYTVPYGVIVPKKVDNLLTPVPVSGTHIGFSTLRMEPCWMALGQAAGIAASLSIRDGVAARNVDVAKLQKNLLDQKAVLIYFTDITVGHPTFEAAQYFGLRGLLPEWEARPDEKITAADAEKWSKAAGVAVPAQYQSGTTTRGQLLEALYRAIGTK